MPASDMAKEPLKDIKFRQLKPTDRTQKVFDGGGLFLEVRPTGSKYWRLKFRIGGKEKSLSFGVYPEVSLAEARKRRDAARALLRDGVDPSQERKQQKRQAKLEADNSFESIAEKWLGKMAGEWKPDHVRRIRESFKLDIFPAIGNTPIAQIGFGEIRD
ncbi:MAG: integrase arm-type DNA-binding domain-containing protein, partial [Rhodanobacter sp.]